MCRLRRAIQQHVREFCQAGQVRTFNLSNFEVRSVFIIKFKIVHSTLQFFTLSAKLSFLKTHPPLPQHALSFSWTHLPTPLAELISGQPLTHKNHRNYHINEGI